MTVFAKWWGSRSVWRGLYRPDGAMRRLHVWLDGGMTVGMRGAGVSCVGHSGMLGIFILGGAGADGILGGGEVFGTLGGGGSVGTGTLGIRAGRPDQRVIGGAAGVIGLVTGRANSMIFANCISACVCSLQNFAVGEAGAEARRLVHGWSA